MNAANGYSPTGQVFDSLLVVVPNDWQPHPTWQQVEAALAQMAPKRSVVLFNSPTAYIRADCNTLASFPSRLAYTIIFYQHAKAPALLVGRRDTSYEGGQNVFQGNRAIVTAWELWSSNTAVSVFRAFYNRQPLGTQFTLRDPATEYTDEDIRRVLWNRSLLPG